jgi:aminoglycoside phosphotransferase (APT) family kinase protein
VDSIFDFEQVVQKFFPNSQLLRAWPLEGGISAEMTVLEIAAADGETGRWIVRRLKGPRRNSRSIEDEFRLLEVIHRLGLVSPAPLALDQSGEIFAGTYMLMAFVEGQPEFAPAQMVDFAVQMAEELGRIHAVVGTRPDLSFLPRLEERLFIQQRAPQLNPSLEEGRIRYILETAWPFPRHNSLTLLHGDYWPGNILWRAGRLAAVIDWEDAVVGDPLADLAISRLDLLWIYGREAMQAFTRQYQAKTAIDTRSLPYWDLYAALRLARLAGADLRGWAAFFEPYGRMDITEQSIRTFYRFFVEQALEKGFTADTQRKQRRGKKY